MKKLFKMTLIGASLAAVSMVQATDVDVAATIPSYCQINLANGSSGTASIAFEGTQTIANFDMSCNTPGGATLTLTPANGDFVNTSNSNIIVNYALEFDADINDFDVGPTDAVPGGNFVRTLANYSSQLADGISAVFSLNMNVDAPGPTALGQTYFPATSAPAGSYSESFAFEVTGL